MKKTSTKEHHKYTKSAILKHYQKNLPFPKALYISHNHGADSWQDMMLISACAHQVIANSSFSWWGAWLNDNLDKIVIAPESWFNNIKDKDLVPSSWRRIKTKQADKMYNDLTIVIPVRVDSAERLRNLNFVTDSLSKLDGIEIVILEADKHPKIEHIDNVRRIFVEDYNPLFYHTKYVNLLCSMVRREFIGVWDCDVIVPKRQIDEAITALRKGKADMFYPFDGRCYNVSNNVLEEYISTSDESVLTSGSDRLSCIYGKHTCGGAFLANRNAFIEAGGDNEQFTGWGAEDLERYKRWEIRGYRVHRTEGAIYHLDHIRGANSRYYSAELKRSTLQVLLESCREPGEFSDIYIPVFIFNLPQRDERREHIISQFVLRPEFEPILIDACIHPIGAVGLWHSIVKAVMQAKERGDDVIILCEDDHIFTENYSAISFIRNIVEAAEQGCDILMGGVGGFGTAVPVAYSRYWVDWFWCTQFVVVYAHSFDKILEYDFKDTDTADGVLSALFTRKLTLYPFISRQQDFGYSDITLNNNRENEMSRLFNNATMRLSVIDNVSKAYRI